MKQYSSTIITTILSGFFFLMAGCAPEVQVVEVVQEVEVTRVVEKTIEVPIENRTTPWCHDTNIIFFPGGSADDSFAPIVYNGAVQAAQDLGANVHYEWSSWSSAEMLKQFEEAIVTHPDGIAIMGHPGSEAFAPLVEKAEAQGIIVTTQNTPLTPLQHQYAAQGFGYVGAENYSAGYALGVETVSRSEVQAGDKAFVWGMLERPGRGQRTQGVIDALEEAGLVVDYLPIDEATDGDAADGLSLFVNYVKDNPDVKIVVTDHGALTSFLPTYLETAGLSKDEVFGVGFDLSTQTVQGIRDEWIDLVIDQQPWLQGYLPILQICLTHHYAFTGLDINTGAGFAHKDNIEILAELADKQIR